MTRRALFAALAAPLIARFLPKAKPTGTLFNPKINIAKLYQEHWGAVIGDTIAVRKTGYIVARPAKVLMDNVLGHAITQEAETVDRLMDMVYP
jgi:hypothetical protein